MPLPIPVPPPGPDSRPGPVSVTPYYIRERQDWAIEQERRNHAEALYNTGEWAMFFLMWHVTDFYTGLVQRCSVCYNTGDSIQDRISAAYNQPRKTKCPSCFGTTFEGGYRAKIIRPAIFVDTDETEREDKRGTVTPDDVDVETVWGFHSRAGDYVIRKDNTRWRLSDPTRETLRTGFNFPGQFDTSLAYYRIRAAYEEPGTVAYTLPPTNRDQIGSILSRAERYPGEKFGDFSIYEEIRGPLIPADLVGEVP